MSILSRERKWFKSAESDSEESIRVMDLNCLAPSLVDPIRYRDCNKKYLDRRTRLGGISREIQYFTPDIICLQEIEQNDLEDLVLDNKSYDLYFSQHLPDQRADGTAIIWKKQKFQCIHQQPVFPVARSSFDQVLRSSLVVLSANTNKQLYIIVSSHLVFNSNRSDVKWYQICAIIDAIYEIKQKFTQRAIVSESSSLRLSKCSSSPGIIWCGDFNLTPMSPMYSSIQHRTPDKALRQVALSSSTSQYRSIHQKLLSGQSALFFSERPSMRSTSLLKLQAALVADLAERPIRCKGGYLGNDWASRVHTHQTTLDEGEVCAWTNKTGPPLKSWQFSMYLSVDSHIEGQKLAKTLEQRPQNAWINPINIKSAQCLKADPLRSSCRRLSLVEPCFTAYHGEQSGCIDYIWYSPEELKVIAICSQAVLRGMPSRIRSIPCQEYAVSDHLPLVVDFKPHVDLMDGRKVYLIEWKPDRSVYEQPRGNVGLSFYDLLEMEFKYWLSGQLQSCSVFTMIQNSKESAEAKSGQKMREAFKVAPS